MERVGLNQNDIVSAVAERVKEMQLETPYQGNKHEQFKKITIQLLINALELGL